MTARVVDDERRWAPLMSGGGGGGGFDVDEDRRRGGGESPIAAGRVPTPPTISGTGSAHQSLARTHTRTSRIVVCTRRRRTSRRTQRSACVRIVVHRRRQPIPPHRTTVGANPGDSFGIVDLVARSPRQSTVRSRRSGSRSGERNAHHPNDIIFIRGRSSSYNCHGRLICYIDYLFPLSSRI